MRDAGVARSGTRGHWSWGRGSWCRPEHGEQDLHKEKGKNGRAEEGSTTCMCVCGGGGCWGNGGSNRSSDDIELYLVTLKYPKMPLCPLPPHVSTAPRLHGFLFSHSALFFSGQRQVATGAGRAGGGEQVGPRGGAAGG